MKRAVVFLALAVILAGCTPGDDQPVLETVGDAQALAAEKPVAGEICLMLPQEAVAQTMAQEGIQSYQWEGYELRLETLDSGDIHGTLEQITGMDYDALTVMARSRSGMQVYETVYTSTAEDGLLSGRVMVADDGNYHYCVSLLSAEEVDASGVYDQLRNTFSVRAPGDSGK